MTTDTAPTGARRRWRDPRLLALLATAYVAVATFPSPAAPPSTTLDGSWITELNRLALSRPVFGRLVAFTYGPLGYLLYPMHLGSHLLQAAVARFAFAAAFAALAWRRLRDARDPFAPAVFAASQAVAAAFGLPFDYQLLLLVLLGAALALETSSVAMIAASGALASVLLFMKATAGIGAFAATGTVLLMWLLGRRRRAGAAIGASAAASVLAAVLLGARWLPSVAEVVPWLRSTLAISAPYSEAMSIVGPGGELALAVPALLGFALLAAFLAWRRLPGRAVALSAIGPLFLAFKHAFVRQDLHAIFFFPMLLGTLGLVASDPALRSRRGRVAIVACLLAALGGAAVIGLAPRRELDGAGAVRGKDVAETVLGITGARSLVAWAARDDLERACGPDAVSGDRVDWLAEATAGRTVGIVPWELAMCVAQAIDCVPSPTLQTYGAYSPELDRWTAAHYSGPGAPDFVVLHLGSFDRRFVTFDTPELWLALRRNYAISEKMRGVFHAGGDFAFLLERRKVPLAVQRRDVGESRVAPDQWVRVPRVGGRLVVRVKMRPTLLHAIARTFFRVDPVYVSLRDPAGRVARIRITPATAASGLALQETPLGPWHVMALFQGRRVLREVDAIRIEGPGLDCYEDEITLGWVEQLDDPGSDQR